MSRLVTCNGKFKQNLKLFELYRYWEEELEKYRGV